MTPPHTAIRLATPEDAGGILAAHVASIREVCAKDYTQPQVDAWTTPKTAENYRKSLADGNAIFVAIEQDRVVGFIELDFARSEVRAFYLRKEAIGRGVGSALLERAEEMFRSRGVMEIQLTSTLTSVGFYEARGFTNHGPTTFKLSSGVELECVKMTKRLSGTNTGATSSGQATPTPPLVAADSSVRSLEEDDEMRASGSAAASGGVEDAGTQIIVQDLGIMPYRDAWAIQERTHERVLAGERETILFVEHPPVITMGRRGEMQGMPNLIATPQTLTDRNVEIVQTDRGGDITFHGPGQLVMYPIIRLHDHQLTVGGYVHLLERVVIDVLASFGVAAKADPNAIGVWTDAGKICALGVRIRKGVSLHGIALNVMTDLSYFKLIVPCGIVDRSVTSLQQILGGRCPSMQALKDALASLLSRHLHNQPRARRP